MKKIITLSLLTVLLIPGTHVYASKNLARLFSCWHKKQNSSKQTKKEKRERPLTLEPSKKNGHFSLEFKKGISWKFDIELRNNSEEEDGTTTVIKGFQEIIERNDAFGRSIFMK